MTKVADLSDDELRHLSDRGFALAFRLLGHREDAADAVQDSLHQLFRSKHQFDQARGSLSAWFLRITRNRAVDIQRKRRPLAAGDDFDPAACSSTSPERSLQRSETTQEVHRALAQLEANSREVLMLRDFHECSYAEISEMLSIPPGTVMSRLHRARLAMAQKLRSNIREKD